MEKTIELLNNLRSEMPDKHFWLYREKIHEIILTLIDENHDSKMELIRKLTLILIETLIL